MIPSTQDQQKWKEIAEVIVHKSPLHSAYSMEGYLIEAIASALASVMTEAREEHDGYCQGAKLLFGRMKPWDKEWQKAHPDKPNTWPDSLRLIEWKIEQSRKEGAEAVLRAMEEVRPCMDIGPSTREYNEARIDILAAARQVVEGLKEKGIVPALLDQSRKEK